MVVVDAIGKTIALNDALQIDASHSWSPNIANSEELKHEWTCRNITIESDEGSPCVWAMRDSGPKNLLKYIVKWNEGILNVPPNWMGENQR